MRASKREEVALGGDRGPVLKIAMSYGRNKFRGKSEGVLFANDEFGDSLAMVRNVFRAEAKREGFTPDAKWIDDRVSWIANHYGQGLEKWKASQNETIGFVYEFSFPSGVTLLLGERLVLEKLNLRNMASRRIV